MNLSNYYIRGRLFPTILTSIPLLIFLNLIVAKFYHEKLSEIFNILPLITNLGLSTALIFLMVQLNRLIAKEIFQRFYFQDELKMPTTNHLLWKDNFFEQTIKEKIQTKINAKFEIKIQNLTEEQADELKSRKQIVTAVSQIRNALRDNKLLLQHNIEYGFFRNLIGGSLIATIFSIFILIYGLSTEQQNFKLIGISLAIVYLIPIILSKPIIRRFGNYYSKILYEQFLSI